MAIGRDMVQDILRDALGDPQRPIGQDIAEVEEGLGATAARGGMKGLGHLGDLLDIPGAFVRGITGAGLSLAQGEFGRAGERLLSSLPGSEELPQMFGMGEGYRAPTGQDLLADLGVDPGHTMDEERRIRIGEAAGLTRNEAIERFTTRYEEESMSEAQNIDFQNTLQQALALTPDLKTGITQRDIERATSASDFAGFAVEIALDPLTYLTMGASAVGKAGKLVSAAAKAGKVAAGPGEAGIRAAENIIGAFKQADTLTDAMGVARKLDIPDVEKTNLLNILPAAWKGGKPDLEMGTGLLSQLRKGQYQVGFKLPGMEDPALVEASAKVIDMLGTGVKAVGDKAMSVRAVADFVAKHPGVKYWPQKLWLSIKGEAKKKEVLGNPLLEEVHLHTEHFNHTTSFESLRHVADFRRGVADLLNGLSTAEKAEASRSAVTLAENPIYREFARSGLVDLDASTDAVKDVLLQYADLLRSTDDEQLQMFRRWGLPVAELAEDFQHMPRELSGEVLDIFANSPNARREWLGTKTRIEREGMQRALLDAERGRKLKGMGFEESEQEMRKILKKHNLPDDTPIWEPDPAKVLVGRAKKAAQEAKVRNLAHVAAEVMGRGPEGAKDLAMDIVRQGLEGEMARATPIGSWNAEKKANYILSLLKEKGLGPQNNELTALELMMKARVQLSDDFADLADAGTKYLSAADGEEFMKYAKNHYWQHLDKPGKVSEVYDAIKGVYQRATLARPGSLARDLVGTTSHGLLAGNHKYLNGAVKGLGHFEDWQKGLRQADDVLELQARGVLRTTKGEALEGRGALSGTPLLGKVEESGVVGGTLRAVGAETVGEKVGKGFGWLNDRRVWWEEVNRVATYRKALAEGMSKDDAVAEVFKYWGNFSELSKLERKYINKIMFFWSWMARSVPTALQTMVAHPVKARLALTLIAGNVRGSEDMPEWMRRMGGWMLGQNDDGSYSTINLGNSTYFSPTISALESDMVKEAMQGNVGRAGGEALREVARSSPPFVAAAYERMTQRESFTGRDWWRDPTNRVGSQMKAPPGFYWLAGNPLGDLLGVEVVSEPTSSGAKIRQVYMDPEAANWLSILPGLEPAMGDMSSFVDPRGESTPGLSPLKGATKNLGAPIYHVAGGDPVKRRARELRVALNQSVDAMPGNALTTNGQYVFPNKDSESGRALSKEYDMLKDKARDLDLRGPQASAWVLDRLALTHPNEARWLRIDARLRLVEKVAKEQKNRKAQLTARR